MKGLKGSGKNVGDPCATCSRPLTEESIVPRSATSRVGFLSNCRVCYNERATFCRKRNPERNRQRNRDYRQRLRREVLLAMGGKCECCGETTPEFLAIDHVKGGGSKERKLLKNSAAGMYAKIKSLGYPKDQYQLLCHNCNCAKGWYGRCPHQRD